MGWDSLFAALGGLAFLVRLLSWRNPIKNNTLIVFCLAVALAASALAVFANAARTPKFVVAHPATCRRCQVCGDEIVYGE